MAWGKIAVTQPARSNVERAFLPHVHMLRAVAILIVVGAHCWPNFAWTPAETRVIHAVFDIITMVMMFISGLLFQHLSGRFRYARYVKHRFSMIILPYVIVSIPALVIVIFFHHREDVWPWVYDMPAWKQAAFFLLTGKHMAPMWFMPMIALFILAAPAFILIDRRNLYPVVLPVTLLISMWLGRDTDLGLGAGLGGVLGKAVFTLPAYISGMAFSRYRATIEDWCQRHVLALALAVAGLTAVIVAGAYPALDLTMPQKILFGMLLLTLFQRIDFGPVITRRMGMIADQSFAIYFIHGYVITALRLAADGARPAALAGGIAQPTETAVGLISLMVFSTLVSLLVVQISRHVFGRRSRMIVGA